MLRHHGGEQVKAGFYLDMDSWEVSTISGTEGGELAGPTTTRYLRIPVIAMLVFAPLMGALFAIFLPFIGLALVAQYVAVKLWHGSQQASHALIGALGPAWQPSTAHLSGTPEERRRKKARAGDAKADGTLDQLEREIDEQSGRDRAAKH